MSTSEFVCIGYYSDMDPKCYQCPDNIKCKQKTMIRKLEKEITENEQARDNQNLERD